jgi:hypothetical protein
VREQLRERLGLERRVVDAGVGELVRILDDATISPRRVVLRLM